MIATLQPPTICLKCGHELAHHTIQTYGRYDYMEIACLDSGDDYDQTCGCNAGFKKVQIKKEFTTLDG
jgi:hypothetical protein